MADATTLPSASPLAITPPSTAKPEEPVGTIDEPFDFTAERPPKRRPSRRPTGRGLAEDVWTAPLAALFPEPATPTGDDANNSTPEASPTAKGVQCPWPAICGTKPALADPTVDPCSRQQPGTLPRNWSKVRAVDGAWPDGKTSHEIDPAERARRNAQDKAEAEAGQRDGFQFDAEEELYTQEQLARARAKMKVHTYEGRSPGCTCSYSYKRKTGTLNEDSPFSFVLKSHNQLQGWFAWEGPKLENSQPKAQICPMRGGWMIRHTTQTPALKVQALPDGNSRIVFSCQKLWSDLKSAKQTGQGNPLADSMRSNEHELYELRILVRDRLIDSRLFQVTDEQEIVMAGARKSGRERRQKRNLSPARLGEGEAQGASDIEPPADSMPWTCYNCQQDNSAADGVCKQCDEVRVSAQQLIEYLRRPMARPSDAAEVLPLAMGFDERCVHVRKVGAGTRSESLSAAFSCLGAEGLLDGTLHVPPRAAARAELALAHDKKYLDAHDYKLPEVEAEAGTEDAGASLEDALAAVEAQAQTRLSVAQASALSAGIVTDVVYSVLSGRSYNGVALVRPCGAHIDRAGSPSGGINVLAVAAKAALRNSAKRVLVVDWAVAHGVGTQRICFDDPAIVTFSMHGTTDRQQRAWVQCDSSDCRKWRKLPVGVDVPSSGKWYCSMNPDRNCDRCQAPEENYADENQKDEPKESDPETVGKGKAEGRNINLTWLANGMGDADYVHAATRLLLPMIYDFSPDVILVGPRFDAANGARRSDEPCGHDKVTPAGFAQILSLLHSAAPGRIVLLCEGGNNLRATCESLVSSVRVLKGSHDKQRLRAGARPKVECVQAVSYTADQLEQYWRGLHHFQDDEEEDEEQEEEEEEEQEEEEEEVGREEEKGATEATEVIDEADSSSRAQVLKSAASRSPVAASIATNVELQQQIKQLQLQLELQQASQTMEMLSTQDAPPAKRKRTTPLAIGSSVALTDGRKGVLRSAGHGYMQVELTAGAQQGEIVHVRSAEVVQGPLKHAPGKTQGSSNKTSNDHTRSNEGQVTLGQPFKKAEVVSCPGCKQRLRLPQQVACFAIKCSGCGYAITPQQPHVNNGSKGTAKSIAKQKPAVKANEMANETAKLATLAQSVTKVVNGENLESLMDLPLSDLRERLGSPNTHKSKAYLVTQLAKQLGIVPPNILELVANSAAGTVATGTEATVLELLTGRALTHKRARPPTQPRDGPAVAPSCSPPKRTKSKAKGMPKNRTHTAIYIANYLLSLLTQVVDARPTPAAASRETKPASAASAAPEVAAEPEPNTSDSYLQFLRKELVGVDVRLKVDQARVGTVIGVVDGGAEGVALIVQSGEAVMEFPASSLEAVPVLGKALG